MSGLSGVVVSRVGKCEVGITLVGERLDILPEMSDIPEKLYVFYAAAMPVNLIPSGRINREVG